MVFECTFVQILMDINSRLIERVKIKIEIKILTFYICIVGALVRGSHSYTVRKNKAALVLCWWIQTTYFHSFVTSDTSTGVSFCLQSLWAACCLVRSWNGRTQSKSKGNKVKSCWCYYIINRKYPSVESFSNVDSQSVRGDKSRILHACYRDNCKFLNQLKSKRLKVKSSEKICHGRVF